MKIETWPIERAIPYEHNARICPQSAIDKVAASIAAFGFRQPILVDGDGVIIAGHTRLLAAHHLGLSEVPVISVADLSPAKIKALRLADNRTAQETSWNAEMLGFELDELAGMEFDLALTGFDEREVVRAMAMQVAAGATDPDDVPPVPEIPRSKAGDVWLLGAHKLACGDCTDAATVQALMASRRAVLMCTDPPYLVDYHGGNHPLSHIGKTGKRDKRWDELLATQDKH